MIYLANNTVFLIGGKVAVDSVCCPTLTAFAEVTVACTGSGKTGHPTFDDIYPCPANGLCDDGSGCDEGDDCIGACSDGSCEVVNQDCPLSGFCDDGTGCTPLAPNSCPNGCEHCDTATVVVTFEVTGSAIEGEWTVYNETAPHLTVQGTGNAGIVEFAVRCSCGATVLNQTYFHMKVRWSCNGFSSYLEALDSIALGDYYPLCNPYP